MRPLAVGCGALLLLVSGCLGLTWLTALALPEAGADGAVLAGSAAIMAGVMGGALAYAGARGGLGAARAWFGRNSLYVWLLLFPGVVVAGSLVIAAGPAASAVFLPPLQFLGALLPALVAVTAASWWRGGATWRGTLVGLAYGGCGATTIALIVEGTVGLLLLVALVSSPGAERLAAAVQQLMESLEGGSMPSGDLALGAFLTPTLIAAAFALVGLVGPLAEEMAKAVGVSLSGPRDRGSGWLWGVTIGAGFGIAEALTFGAMAVSLPGWPANMVVRAFTTLMHATMGGIAGMGAYELATGHRRRGAGLLLLAWIGHAAWNSAVLASTIGGLAVATDGPFWSTTLVAFGTLAVLVLFTGVVTVFVAMSRAAGPPASDSRSPVVPGPATDAGPMPVAGADAAVSEPDTSATPAPPADEPSASPVPAPQPPGTGGDVIAPRVDEPDDEGIPGLGYDVTGQPEPPEAG